MTLVVHIWAFNAMALRLVKVLQGNTQAIIDCSLSSDEVTTDSIRRIYYDPLSQSADAESHQTAVQLR